LFRAPSRQLNASWFFATPGSRPRRQLNEPDLISELGAGWRRWRSRWRRRHFDDRLRFDFRRRFDGDLWRAWGRDLLDWGRNHGRRWRWCGRWFNRGRRRGLGHDGGHFLLRNGLNYWRDRRFCNGNRRFWRRRYCRRWRGWRWRDEFRAFLDDLQFEIFGGNLIQRTRGDPCGGKAQRFRLGKNNLVLQAELL
jgi:hypothetical protein